MSGLLQRLGSRAIGQQPDVRPVPPLYRGEAIPLAPLDVPLTTSAEEPLPSAIASRPTDMDQPRPGDSVIQPSVAERGIAAEGKRLTTPALEQRSASRVEQVRFDKGQPAPFTSSSPSTQLFSRPSKPQASTGGGSTLPGEPIAAMPAPVVAFLDPLLPNETPLPPAEWTAQAPIDFGDPLGLVDAIEPLLPPSAQKENAGRISWDSDQGNASTGGSAPTEVHVTIGRIEVTAVQEAPSQPVRPTAGRPPRMSLDDYLASRRRQR